MCYPCGTANPGRTAMQTADSASPLEDPAKEQDEVATLIAGLSAGSARDRRLAVRGLFALGKRAEPAIGALVAAFCDRDLRVRSGAVRVLGMLGKLAVPALIEAVLNGHEDLRRVAAVTLGEIGA